MMPEMSVEEHLKLARRLHFQGNRKEAMLEYKVVLELDPGNLDAESGIQALKDEAQVNESGNTAAELAEDTSGKLKTNFFVKQASAGSSPLSKAKGLMMTVFMLLMLGGVGYGGYIMFTFYMNADNMNARQNIAVNFERARMKDGQPQVNIEVTNKNPYLVRNLLVFYEIRDRSDNLLKEGKLTLSGSVPAGDRRTFPDVVLGKIEGEPGKLKARVETLQLGPKRYKLKEKYANKFMDAAAMKDKDALYEYEELTQDMDDFVPAFIGYGRALAARSKFDEALKQYQKALELDPDSANAHYYSAVALFYKNDQTNAKKEIDLAANLAPDDPEILWNQKYLFTMKAPDKKVDQKKKGK